MMNNVDTYQICQNSQNCIIDVKCNNVDEISKKGYLLSYCDLIFQYMRFAVIDAVVIGKEFVREPVRNEIGLHPGCV